MCKFLFVLIFISFCVVAGNIKCVESTAPSFLKGTVGKITDGDTVRVDNAKGTYSIRLLNIDAPETNYNGQSQGYWAQFAKQNITKLLPLGTPVVVKFDKEICDAYGRWLGIIYSGNTDINAQQLKDGVAVIYCIYPNIGSCLEYSQYTKAAIDGGKSFMNDPSIMLPYLFRHGGVNIKPVANMTTNKVYQPADLEQVPIHLRIFFFKMSDVQSPFSQK